MTTIVYANGTMIGDGCETSCADDESTVIIREDCVKVWKLEGGRLFGAARASEDIERLRRSLLEGKKPPKLDDINAILVEPTGEAFTYEGHIWQKSGTPYCAVGTGAVFAWPLFKAGLNIRDVFKFASSCDPYSGGLVTEVHLGKKRK